MRYLCRGKQNTPLCCCHRRMSYDLFTAKVLYDFLVNVTKIADEKAFSEFDLIEWNGKEENEEKSLSVRCQEMWLSARICLISKHVENNCRRRVPVECSNIPSVILVALELSTAGAEIIVSCWIQTAAKASAIYRRAFRHFLVRDMSLKSTLFIEKSLVVVVVLRKFMNDFTSQN